MGSQLTSKQGLGFLRHPVNVCLARETCPRGPPLPTTPAFIPEPQQHERLQLLGVTVPEGGSCIQSLPHPPPGPWESFSAFSAARVAP